VTALPPYLHVAPRSWTDENVEKYNDEKYEVNKIKHCQWIFAKKNSG
jgi:hypothetical protein